MIAKNSGKTSYNVSEAKKEIMTAIRAYYAKDAEGKYYYDPVNRLPFYLEGPPGIGKTELVRQITEELGIGFVSFSVTHHTRNSIIGLPVIEDLEDGGKYTEYTMSEVIAAVVRECEAGQKEGILLLDEFNCASDTIMPVMLAFLQTRNIGLYHLPEGWSLVLCGNPVEYNAAAKRFTPAILDRVRRLDLLPEAEDFFAYAETKAFNYLVLDYLKLNPQNIYKVTNNREHPETVTARGWENLARTIDAYTAEGLELNRMTVLQFIKSVQIADDFWNYYWLHHNSFTEAELLKILDGDEDPALVESLNKNDRSFGESALDILEKGLLRNVVYEAADKLAVKIGRVFDFLDKLKDAQSLKEKFFFRVTENTELCNVVFKVKSVQYLQIAKQMYGVAG